MRMTFFKNKKVSSALALTGVLCATVFLAACTNNGLTGGTAATVNGQDIPEDSVTTFIQNIRESNKLMEEPAWGKWLAQTGQTPETLRQQVIDQLVNEALIKQAAKDNEVSVDKARIDEIYDSMKSRYENDENWKKALKDAGTSEEAYRESIELQLLRQDLADKVYTPEEVNQQELDQLAQQYGSNLNGAKRSSHILMKTDEAKAQEVLDKINSGELSFEEAVKDYSEDSGSKEKGGDVGWDKMNQFVPAYTDALNNLKKGQVSGLVKSDFGFHIIKCTDVFNGPNEIKTASQLPEDIQESLKASLENNQKEQYMLTWLKDLHDKADIKINEMPKNVPYNVKDMDKYKAEVEEAQKQAQEQAEQAQDPNNAPEEAAKSEENKEQTEREKTEG